MPDERERRLALNEAAFRVANERMDQWEERRDVEEPVSYYCECAEITCRERIHLRIREYEHVRDNPRHFAVVPGHEIPDVESVVERGEGYVIIEKHPEVDPIVDATDPRGA